MRCSLPLALAGLLLLSAFAQQKDAKPANLVANGGFDQGADPGSYKTFAKGDKFPGWTITKGSIDEIGSYYKCAHKWCLDMNGNEPGAIRQTIATEPGKKYELSFMLSANPQCGKPKKALEVGMSWDDPDNPDRIAGGLFPVTATGDIKWAKHTMPFTAGAGKTHLTFQSKGESSACGPLLDSVSVTLVPDAPAPAAKPQ